MVARGKNTNNNVYDTQCIALFKYLLTDILTYANSKYNFCLDYIDFIILRTIFHPRLKYRPTQKKTLFNELLYSLSIYNYVWKIVIKTIYFFCLEIN